MNTAQQDLHAQTQAGVGLGLKAMEISLDSAEKLIRYHLDLSKAGLDACSQSMRELMTTGDQNDILGNLGKIASETASGAIACSSELCRDLSKNHGSLYSLTEEHFNALSRSGASTLSNSLPVIKG